MEKLCIYNGQDIYTEILGYTRIQNCVFFLHKVKDKNKVFYRYSEKWTGLAVGTGETGTDATTKKEALKKLRKIVKNAGIENIYILRNNWLKELKKPFDYEFIFD